MSRYKLIPYKTEFVLIDNEYEVKDSDTYFYTYDHLNKNVLFISHVEKDRFSFVTVEGHHSGILHKKIIAATYQLKDLPLISNTKDELINMISGNAVLNNTYTEADLINAAKYGYEFHKITQFPEHGFEDSCINNFKQKLESDKLNFEERYCEIEYISNVDSFISETKSNTIKITKLL